MRRPQGQLTRYDPDGKTYERDTFTCTHCNSVVIVEPRQDPATMGGFCQMCMGHVCMPCAGQGCTPFEKKLDAIERRGRLLAAVERG